MDRSTLEPLRMEPGQATQSLSADQREYIILRLRPHQQLHALRSNLDRDWHSPDFEPWTAELHEDLDCEPWYRNMEHTIDRAVGSLFGRMRTHLRYLEQKVRPRRGVPGDPLMAPLPQLRFPSAILYIRDALIRRRSPGRRCPRRHKCIKLIISRTLMWDSTI